MEFIGVKLSHVVFQYYAAKVSAHVVKLKTLPSIGCAKYFRYNCGFINISLTLRIGFGKIYLQEKTE